MSQSKHQMLCNGVATAEFSGIAYRCHKRAVLGCFGSFIGVLFSLRLALVHVLQLYRVCTLHAQQPEARACLGGRLAP